jgi:hypothetical protein
MHQQASDHEQASLLTSLPAVGTALILSTIAWTILFVAFPPDRQNFPLDDDWSFARGVFGFAADYRIGYSRWAAMPQLGQWLWALPLVHVLGPTHVALRVSTIVLSWLGLAGFFDLLKQSGVARRDASLACAALAFNPLFFLLQGTFMTDVPALSFSLVSLAMYSRAIRHGRPMLLAPAVIFSLLAVGTRQNTLVVPLVAALLVLQAPRLRLNAVWILAVALPLIVGLAIQYWFRQRSDVLLVDPHLPAPYVLVFWPYLAVHFFGLTVIPLLPLSRRLLPIKPFLLATAIMLFGAAYWHHFDSYLPFKGLFPYATNLLTPFGAFQFQYPGERPIVMGETSRMVATILGCLAGGAFLVRLGRQLAAGLADDPLIWFSLLQLPLIWLAPLFDRYLLFLLPGALGVFVPRIGESLRGKASLPLRSSGLAEESVGPACASDALTETELPLMGSPSPPLGRSGAEARALVDYCVSWLLLLATAASSVALMHDWLAWNSARWALGRRTADNGVKPQDIEGGFEWDGWYTDRTVESPHQESEGLIMSVTAKWFPQITGRYALAFSLVPDSVVVGQEPYNLWLAPGKRFFYLLKYQPGAS